MYSLEQIADMLESAPRTEGQVRLSDNLARAIAAALRIQARGEPPNAVPVTRR